MNASRPPIAAVLFDLDHVVVEGGRSGEALFDGVREMLAALRAAGYPLAGVTEKARPVWERTESLLACGPFDRVVTGDEVPRAPLSPDALRTAARSLAIDAEAVAVVAGSHGALAAGRAAGMAVGAALWPMMFSSGDTDGGARVGEIAPDWRFTRPADVTRTFARWC